MGWINDDPLFIGQGGYLPTKYQERKQRKLTRKSRKWIAKCKWIMEHNGFIPPTPSKEDTFESYSEPFIKTFVKWR